MDEKQKLEQQMEKQPCCPICTNPFTQTTQMVKLQCNHLLCQICMIDTLFSNAENTKIHRSVNCPLCREPFFDRETVLQDEPLQIAPVSLLAAAQAISKDPRLLYYNGFTRAAFKCPHSKCAIRVKNYREMDKHFRESCKYLPCQRCGCFSNSELMNIHSETCTADDNFVWVTTTSKMLRIIESFLYQDFANYLEFHIFDEKNPLTIIQRLMLAIADFVQTVQSGYPEDSDKFPDSKIAENMFDSYEKTYGWEIKSTEIKCARIITDEHFIVKHLKNILKDANLESYRLNQEPTSFCGWVSGKIRSCLETLALYILEEEDNRRLALTIEHCSWSSIITATTKLWLSLLQFCSDIKTNNFEKLSGADALRLSGWTVSCKSMHCCQKEMRQLLSNYLPDRKDKDPETETNMSYLTIVWRLMHRVYPITLQEFRDNELPHPTPGNNSRVFLSGTPSPNPSTEVLPSSMTSFPNLYPSSFRFSFPNTIDLELLSFIERPFPTFDPFVPIQMHWENIMLRSMQFRSMQFIGETTATTEMRRRALLAGLRSRGRSEEKKNDVLDLNRRQNNRRRVRHTNNNNNNNNNDNNRFTQRNNRFFGQKNNSR